MKERIKEIIVSDSRSENMMRRLLGVSTERCARRRRWMLMANGGLIVEAAPGSVLDRKRVDLSASRY